jgi:tetratricopeptide (TPR) repeat protein
VVLYAQIQQKRIFSLEVPGVRDPMAFGFGFNKTKALSSAERYIQQGKLHNAIAEYEKVMKSDPKDLTVRNTVGDLYARIGDTDKAIEHFRSVGDAYAAAGFTVKAIAMYKKLTKLKPSVECVLKLAELYSQQGLQNDSRSQYLQVAEQMLHAGQLEAAARIFQKVLEIDPENTGMQTRLADVYVKLGRNDDARNLLQRTAEALQTRGNAEGLKEILRRLLEIDPGNSHALLMQGRMAMERGDSAEAMAHLRQVTNIQSNREGLRLLIRATLAQGNTEEAGALSAKLFALHQDTVGLLAYADQLMRAGTYAEALRVYDSVGEPLFASNAPEVVENLKACIGHVSQDAAALELLRVLFERSGDKSHLSEVAELQAHACVQAGNLEKARELYLQLAAIEPDNPMHAQNYHQIVERLGGKKAVPADESEAAPRVIEELERRAPALELNYPQELAAELRRAITDADLFVSYNLPAKASAPLLAVLPRAPQDPRINQRLAALHARSGRFKEAAECCFVLARVYREAGHQEHAARCVEVADHYAKRAGVEISSPAEVAEEAPVAATAAAAAVAEGDEAPAPAAPAESEIDISSDWESAVSIPAAANAGAVETAASQTSSELDGLIEEIRFYLQHGLLEEAESAIEKCAKQAPEAAELASLRAQLAAKQSGRTARKEEFVQPAEPVAAGDKPASKLNELVLDLEESLSSGGFGSPAPRAAAAAAAGGAPASFRVAPQPPSAPAGFGGSAARFSAPAQHDTDSELAEIFSEFKEGLEQQPGTLTEGEDPETHYNLGVAFKEMGLLDEAIGELQKVCQAVERGHTFPHVMQAFTWLAQCFLEKGVPQAAIRWYEKALKLPAIDSEARTALHYELAAAYEAAENKQAALNHFMEVYGANIEYRDVSERIKALKS